MSVALRVLGVGSPFGDDAAGLLAARLLGPRLDPGRVAVMELDRPGASLVRHLDGTHCALIVDAVLTGAAAGTLHRFEGEAIVAAARRQLSSHGLGLAEALELAAALGSAPRRLILWGIEADPHAGPEPSPALRHALPSLVEAIAAEIGRLLPADGAVAR